MLENITDPSRKNPNVPNFYGMTALNNYKRSCVALFLLAVCLKCDAKLHDYELQDNFDPKRFFSGTWYETQRLNGVLSRWGRCLEIRKDSYLHPGKISFTTSVYVPFLFSWQSFKSLTKLDSQDQANFLLNISVMKWNVSVISTDYENYALAHSTPLPSAKFYDGIIQPNTEILFVFRRNKNDNGYVKELADAAEKNRIPLNELLIYYC